VEAAHQLGITAPELGRVRGLIGKGGDKLIPEAFGIEEESPGGIALDELKGEIFRNRYAPHLQPTPGAADLLRRFREDGLRLVVATSAGEEDLAILLERAGVADLVDACTTASDVDDSKPDPDVVQAALRLAAVPAGSAVMLGDTPYDIEAARLTGIRVIAVRTGGWDDSALVGAAAIYDDPADLLARYDSSLFGTDASSPLP
jgi:HAD superfamily hydrolase (TIGR01509 family)